MVTLDQIEDARAVAAEALSNARTCGGWNKTVQGEPCASCQQVLAEAREVVDALITQWTREQGAERVTPGTVHALAKVKGWWRGHDAPEYDPTARIPAALALIHSEVSEALEEYRSPDVNVRTFRLNGYDETHTAITEEIVGLAADGAKPEGFGVELADVIIRVYDLAAALDIDIEGLVRLKHLFNGTRPMRHGGKRA